ncbi:MAG TPA: hypothetical protein VG937_15975 [Polyangiaceae bacterium]|jgi:hypothetical protein|nr:hypothetical protein [Polyangiaceae bacterium]
MLGVVADEYRYQIVDEEHRYEARDSERFNRIDFALSVLDVLRPNMNITVYEGCQRMKIRRGRDWSVGPDAVWAIIAVPANASRYYIAFALAEMVGKADRPFVVDLAARARALSAPVPTN